LGEARHPDAANAPGLLAGPLQMSAKRPHRVGGMQDILAFQKAADGRFADRQGPQYESAMRNRFVAGHAGTALHGAALTGG
jgi:hypothetical protein